jgi:carbon storage regulator
MLVLSRKAGERISIGDGIEVAVVRIHKGRVQLGFSGPPEISIRREEICRRVGVEAAGRPAARPDQTKADVA